MKKLTFIDLYLKYFILNKTNLFPCGLIVFVELIYGLFKAANFDFLVWIVETLFVSQWSSISIDKLFVDSRKLFGYVIQSGFAPRVKSPHEDMRSGVHFQNHSTHQQRQKRDHHPRTARLLSRPFCVHKHCHQCPKRTYLYSTRRNKTLIIIMKVQKITKNNAESNKN